MIGMKIGDGWREGVEVSPAGRVITAEGVREFDVACVTLDGGVYAFPLEPVSVTVGETIAVTITINGGVS